MGAYKIGNLSDERLKVLKAFFSYTQSKNN